MCVWWNHPECASSPSSVGAPVKSFQATQICGYSSRRASCEAKVTEYEENGEILAPSFMCSVSPSPSAVLFSALPLQRGPRSGRQARALGSNSAALADVLRLTLAHRGALCRHAASLDVPPVAHRRIVTDTRSNTHTFAGCHPR